MPRLTAADFAPEVLKLFDQYVHGGISRRGFLDGAGKYTIGGMTALGLLEALAPDFAQAQQVAPADPRIVASRQAFDSPQGHGKASGYLVKPARPPDLVLTAALLLGDRAAALKAAEGVKS